MSKRKKIGLSPGSLIYTGENKSQSTPIKTILYNKDKVEEFKNIQFTQNVNDKNQWLEIFGVHDAQLIQKIGTEFKIHSLNLEDIMDISNRVKVEITETGVFCIIQNLKLNQKDLTIRSEQISLFFAEHFLISFQEDEEDSLQVVRKRMQAETSRLRSRDCDYLFYAIVDYIVDCYFLILESLSEEINKIEERVHKSLDEDLIIEIYSVRTKLIKFRNLILPLREELNRIKKNENKFIKPETIPFLKDIEDHLIQINEISDSQRELLNGIKELIYSQSSLKLNQDIKWLTVISTISLPIVLLTGIYGMNFKHMPELDMQYGYLLWWIATIGIIFSLFIYFKRKNLF